MIDQHNIDQYNKETSQIHAPADLIRRTKEAVREEEQRIAGEGLQQNTEAQPKRSYGKVYKWALPVAAAILCVILYNISGMMFGRNMSGSGSGSAMDMASSAEQSSDNGAGAQAGAADMSEGMATDTTAEEESVTEDIEYEIAAMETAEEEDISEDYDGGQSADAGTATTAAAENAQSFDSTVTDTQSAQEASYSAKMDNYAWKIREVDEIPSADDHRVWEKHIRVRGIDFLVTYDMDDIWCAYAAGDDGKLYLIFTEAIVDEFSVEEFANMAYDQLMKTTNSAE